MIVDVSLPVFLGIARAFGRFVEPDGSTTSLFSLIFPKPAPPLLEKALREQKQAKRVPNFRSVIPRSLSANFGIPVSNEPSNQATRYAFLWWYCNENFRERWVLFFSKTCSGPISLIATETVDYSTVFFRKVGSSYSSPKGKKALVQFTVQQLQVGLVIYINAQPKVFKFNGCRAGDSLDC